MVWMDTRDEESYLSEDIYMGTLVYPPVAAFSASSVSGKKPLTVKFTDKSTRSPTSWSWNFGDKSTSTAKNAVHKYTKAGKYTVSLTVKNAAGSNTAKKTKYITVK
jgi:PKD repeat protein